MHIKFIPASCDDARLANKRVMLLSAGQSYGCPRCVAQLQVYDAAKREFKTIAERENLSTLDAIAGALKSMSLTGVKVFCASSTILGPRTRLWPARAERIELDI